MKQDFNIEKLSILCQTTHEKMQCHANRSINITLVVRNWLFGWYITEFEQQGKLRAKYGCKLIAQLANTLKKKGLKGMSSTSLKQCRSFYFNYKTISQTVSDQSDNELINVNHWQMLATQLLSHFSLSWSHYVTLLSLDNPQEQRFYEIEATENSWIVRELERQISSSLYERLSLSRDKTEIQRLSEQGLIIEKAADLIKNPLVLE